MKALAGLLALFLLGPAGPAPRLAQDPLAPARERSLALSRRGSWSPGEIEALLPLFLVDPDRFVTEEPFRAEVVSLLPRALPPDVSPALRDALLQELNQVRGFGFTASDAVEHAWSATPREALLRRVPYAPAGQRFDSDVEGRLEASVYSLPSFFFDLATADAFLTAVRAADPARTILVLTDSPLRERLEPRAQALGVRLLDTYGRPYSPWPRDPFSLVHTPEGAVRVLVRPNLQGGREEDGNLGPELVQNLPVEIEGAWKHPTWTEAPVPFHNGQVLLTRDAAWVTLHTLEPAILARLGLARVPVETFTTPEGVHRYATAADEAARELGTLYGRPVRFVHPRPDSPERMRRIGGGAGYDLDSLVTLLPGKRGGAALVADVSLGRDLLGHLAPSDREALRRGYGLSSAGEPLAAAQRTPTAEGLGSFLDLVAENLAAEGLTVRRLPLLSVPVALLTAPSGLDHAEFLITWNNVVVETRGRSVRAEGFSSLLPAGDARAREEFAALGAHLDLFPPLLRSVVLNGGYRCASNHLRAPS